MWSSIKEDMRSPWPRNQPPFSMNFHLCYYNPLHGKVQVQVHPRRSTAVQGVLVCSVSVLQNVVTKKKDFENVHQQRMAQDHCAWPFSTRDSTWYLFWVQVSPGFKRAKPILKHDVTSPYGYVWTWQEEDCSSRATVWWPRPHWGGTVRYSGVNGKWPKLSRVKQSCNCEKGLHSFKSVKWREPTRLALPRGISHTCSTVYIRVSVVWSLVVRFSLVMPWDLMDESCEPGLLTEILRPHVTGHRGFTSPLYNQKVRQTRRQTDREECQETEITRSTSTLQGMNHLTVSVTLPFLSLHPIYLSSTLSADEWPFRSVLLWNAQSLSENRMMTCKKTENFYLDITVFILVSSFPSFNFKRTLWPKVIFAFALWKKMSFVLYICPSFLLIYLFLLQHMNKH